MPKYRVDRTGAIVPYDAPSPRSPRRGSTRQWRRVRAAVIAASPVCAICGATENLTADHITPIADGGAMYDVTNLRVLCATCNARGGGYLSGGAASSS